MCQETEERPKITVRFYTLVRQIVGTDCVFLEAEDMEEAVKQLEKRFGPRLQEPLGAFRIGKSANLLDYCLLLLNGRSIDRQRLNQIKLTAGDILYVFPPAAGG